MVAVPVLSSLSWCLVLINSFSLLQDSGRTTKSSYCRWHQVHRAHPSEERTGGKPWFCGLHHGVCSQWTSPGAQPGFGSPRNLRSVSLLYQKDPICNKRNLSWMLFRSDTKRYFILEKNNCSTYCKMWKVEEKSKFGLTVHKKLQSLKKKQHHYISIVSDSFSCFAGWNWVASVLVFLYKFHLVLTVLILFANPLLSFISS